MQSQADDNAFRRGVTWCWIVTTADGRLPAPFLIYRFAMDDHLFCIIELKL
jgi:hypothetical protein